MGHSKSEFQLALRVVVLSLAATYLFFYEYVPPLKRVHFIADIDGYHYPLLNYAFKRLKQGTLPEWDPTIYSGMSYVGNVQSGLFYPPNWWLHWINHRRTGMRFFTIEILLVFHYWLAFFFAWRWLRRHTRGDLPALLGAALYGFSGYGIAEAQHLGVVCGYAWFPLAMLSIDDCVERQDWRCLWKLAVAVAMVFLAGYPSTWLVLCAISPVYALVRGGWRVSLATLGAILFSALLTMVQLAPTMEIASLKNPDGAYGAGIAGGLFTYAGYFTPNYYDQSGMTKTVSAANEQYNYFGSVFALSLGALLWRRKIKPVLPAVVCILFTLWIILDPGGILAWLVPRLPYAGEICREWNFMAALSLFAAMLAAIGVDAFTAGWRFRVPAWFATALVSGWSARQWMIWRAGGADFATGAGTLIEAAVHIMALVLALSVRQPALRMTLVLMAVFVEYKVYGTSRRFNSDAGAVDVELAQDARTGGLEMKGVDNAVYLELQRNPHFRILMADASPATDFRHYLLSAVQGFDPFLPKAYIEAVHEGWETNRLFRIPVGNTRFMDDFAVRYVFAVSGTSEDEQLFVDQRFRLMQPATSYFRVYEYRAAKPAFRFDDGTLEAVHWEPERRVFRIRSQAGGPFHLIEQFFPGWEARIDGAAVPIERVRTAFQAIHVPAGEHKVEFHYRSKGLRLGAAITGLSLLALVACAYASRSSLLRRAER